MARYDTYIEEVQIKLQTGLILFVFDNGDQILMDRGELAEVLSNYKRGVGI